MIDLLVYLLFQLNHLSISSSGSGRSGVFQAGVLYEEALGFSAYLFHMIDLFFMPRVQKSVRDDLRIAVVVTESGLWLSGEKLIMWRESNCGLNSRCWYSSPPCHGHRHRTCPLAAPAGRRLEELPPQRQMESSSRAPEPRSGPSSL